MKAAGVDYNSKNQLKKLAAEGYTAEEISSMIQVKEESVKSWMEYLGFNKKPEEKKETKAKVAKKDKTEEE